MKAAKQKAREVAQESYQSILCRRHRKRDVVESLCAKPGQIMQKKRKHICILSSGWEFPAHFPPPHLTTTPEKSKIRDWSRTGFENYLNIVLELLMQFIPTSSQKLSFIKGTGSRYRIQN
jgi:hypothetical protein